jgi:hypothetical protein
MVTGLRLAFQVIITIVVSVILGLAVALISLGPSRPFPFSECLDYQLNAAPNSCRPLAPILLLFAGVLLVLAAFSLFRNRLMT